VPAQCRNGEDLGGLQRHSPTGAVAVSMSLAGMTLMLAGGGDAAEDVGVLEWHYPSDGQGWSSVF
jgi:hypothetical protein